MSDSKNKDDNDRYDEGYKEGRSGEYDLPGIVVDGLFFGGDQIKDAGRRAGRDDRWQFDSKPKAGSAASSESSSAEMERNSLHTSDTSSSREPSSSGYSGYSGYSGESSGGSSSHDTPVITIVLGLLSLAAGIAYFVWVISTMKNGGPDSFGEFVLLLPGAGLLVYAGFYIGIIFIVGFAAIGVLYVIFQMVFG